MITNKLNYSFVNEDPLCDLQVAPITSQVVGSIAGSGFRFLPLLSLPELKKLVVIDCSAAQIIYTQKLLDKIRQQSYEQFFDELDPLLVNGLESVLYSGQHEKKYWKRSFIAQFFFNKEDFTYPEKLIKKNKWKLFSTLYSTFLWTLEKTGRIPPRLKNQSYSEILSLQILKLTAIPFDKNFFLQQFLTGHCQTKEAFERILPQDMYTKIQLQLKHIEVQFIHADILVALERTQEQFDFFSLSNVINHLNESETHRLFEGLNKNMKPNGRICIRSYCNPFPLQHQQFRNLEELKKITDQEMTGAYKIEIIEKLPLL